MPGLRSLHPSESPRAIGRRRRSRSSTPAVKFLRAGRRLLLQCAESATTARCVVAHSQSRQKASPVSQTLPKERRHRPIPTRLRCKNGGHHCRSGAAWPRGGLTKAALLGLYPAFLALWFRAEPYWIRPLGARAPPPYPASLRRAHAPAKTNQASTRSHWRLLACCGLASRCTQPRARQRSHILAAARRLFLTNCGPPPSHCTCTLRTRSDFVGRRNTQRNKSARESLAIERQATSDLSFEGLPVSKRRHEGGQHLLGHVWPWYCVVNVSVQRPVESFRRFCVRGGGGGRAAVYSA